MRGRPKGSKNGFHSYKKVMCITCGKVKEVYTWEVKDGRKFCSKECSDIFKIGKPNTSSTKFKKGQRAWNEGKIWPKGIREKMSLAHIGKNTGSDNGMWKGDNVGYHAVHNWIYRVKGNPYRCEHCNTTIAKKFEWANKDHSYKRILEDYISLCTSCHRKFDYEFNR